MKRIAVITGIACLLAIPGVGGAQTGSTQPPPKTSKPKTTQPPSTAAAKTGGGLSAADQSFVREAAVGGMAEVELGRLASDKASNADVKQFGKRMVDDHGKANDELKKLASEKNVTLPTELDAKHKATVDRLSKLSADAFDRAYVKEMVADHDHDVQAFTKESKSGADPDVKAWAGKTLPTLQEHQKMVHDLSAKIGKGAAKSSPKSEPKKQ
jgi:putative membrane protein